MGWMFLGWDDFSWFDLIICSPTDSSHENQFVLPSFFEFGVRDFGLELV